jgi:EAL and modified HD-GYP domain-containing signal transduction protein
MVLLGRQGLHQWLTLMLFCSSKGGELDVALRETAFARARLVELLAQGKCSRAEGEQAFLVGLLSLVDALFQMPLEEALQKLALPEPVLDALLHRGGKFGTYLSLAIACEKGYEGAVEELARECGLSSDQVNAKHLAALNWALEFNDKLDELDRSEPAAG